MEISNSAYYYRNCEGLVREAEASLPEEQVVRAWLSVATPGAQLRTLTSREILVLSPGELNIYDGPDLLDAELIIDGKGIRGAIEIHRRIEEWYLHKHHLNRNYDAVILHVVLHPPDGPVPASLPETLALASILTPQQRRQELYSSGKTQQFACSSSSPETGPSSEEAMLVLASAQRLSRKLRTVRRRTAELAPVSDTKQNQQQLLYELIARALGFGGNADLMQDLARQLPLSELVSAGIQTPAEIHFAVQKRMEEQGLDHNVRKKSVRPQNRVSQRIPLLVSSIAFLINEEALTLFRNAVIEQAGSNSSDALFVLLRHRISGLGAERCREMIVNAIAPWAICSAESSGDSALYRAALALYYRSPEAAENRLTRSWKAHFGTAGQRISGKHQGMIEMLQQSCGSGPCRHCLLTA
jgi:uncharacterized protein DUF2851